MTIKRLLNLRPTSLKQKTALFILLPTFIIMVSISWIGLQLVRQVLLDQWQETAITKLQRSAHYVDMRLMRPKEILRFLQQKEQKILQWSEINLLLDQLRSLDGVVHVDHKWYDQAEIPSNLEPMGMMHKNAYHRLDELTISPPVYNAELLSETVSLFARFKDKDGRNTGYIEVVLSFYDLVDQIVKSPWWKSNQAFIIDRNRNILASTSLGGSIDSASKREGFGLKDNLEMQTWNAMQNAHSGTIFGPGIPPRKVSGFYQLTEAPWTLVIMAPGEQVLQPILEFRTYYYLISGVGILFAILYLRLITEKTTRAINRLSRAAEELSNGTFAEALVVESRDEVGILTTNFNVMAKQLHERLQLQKAMNVAREVQQNLLPQKGFATKGLEIAGTTLYCDETGGDYIDILNASHEKRKATIVVGDVVGHGIGAALLMATVRALLRGRACRPGTLSDIANDVNRLLCKDTSHSGNFVTLFYMEIDRQNSLINWVRCGHEPAIVYSPDSNSFSELRGEGIVLGFEATSTFSENTITFTAGNQVILIGSDGVWDVENEQGEAFGKERVKALLERYHTLSAEMLIQKITEQIAGFQSGHPQNDDITLAIIKTW
jgi:sigma-B regulation protein RsbU (phosphoserine phosphatase)